MTEKRLSEISCPLCGKIFRVRKGRPRTLKQWKVSLMVHLTASPQHRLVAEEADDVVNSYLKKVSANS